MEKLMKVSVYECDNATEMQLIKSKLEAANISCEIDNKYMSFTTTPTATSLKLMVNITDEAKSFEIIDAWLAEQK